MQNNKNNLLLIAEDAFKYYDKNELSVHDIAIYAENKLNQNKEDLVNRFATALSSNCKTKNPKFKKAINPKTKKSRKGYYRLKIIKKLETKLIELPKTSTLYVGKAGEFAVLSELLFYEFNASIMSIDDGIDIVASKNSRYFHIQVKTTIESIKDQNKFMFNLEANKFYSNNDSITFYIFVLRTKNKYHYLNDYAVIPSSLLKPVFANNPTLAKITIQKKEKRYFIDNLEITYFINNFLEIK